MWSLGVSVCCQSSPSLSLPHLGPLDLMVESRTLVFSYVAATLDSFSFLIFKEVIGVHGFFCFVFLFVCLFLFFLCFFFFVCFFVCFVFLFLVFLKFLFIYYCLFVFSGPHRRHMEVPRLGGSSELQLPASTTAMATPDP